MDNDSSDGSASSPKSASSDAEMNAANDEAVTRTEDGTEIASNAEMDTTNDRTAEREDLALRNQTRPGPDANGAQTAESRRSPELGLEQTLQNNTAEQLEGGSDGGSRGRTAPPDSTSADYSLCDNPPNLAKIRQVLFECKEPLEISLKEFETYWPFIDNVWVKQRSNASREGHCTTDYYMCRLRRPTRRAPESRPLPEGKRPRKKKAREGGICNSRIKVVKFEGAYSTVTIARTTNSSAEHSHDLDYSDQVKRNSGLMEFARKEAAKGYLPSSIFTKFKEEPDRLVEAGGKFFTATDVRNVSAKWRMQNPDMHLVPHSGYEYQKGHGIVKAHGVHSVKNTPPAKPQLSPDTLAFPQFSLDFLHPYLPKHGEKRDLPHITLSYATSMDSRISLEPGMQTVLSGPEAKLMTHYLRSRHDAILVGVGTILADNPGLNCRLEGAGGFGGLGRMWQPRPIVVDPLGRWPIHPECRILRTAVEGKGRAPWVIVSPGAQLPPQKLMLLKGYGGDFLRMVEYSYNWRLRWEAIFRALASEGIKSVMIEGGGTVLSELLNPEYSPLVDSIIVTVAPTYLGRGGVPVCADQKRDQQGKPTAALNPKDVQWTPLGQNVIMCGKI